MDEIRDSIPKRRLVVTDARPPVHALTRFGINTPNAQRLLQFYEQAFGARLISRTRLERTRFAQGIRDPGSAESTSLNLGEATIELLEFADPGRPYPHDLSPLDTRFQHLGIVVTDMQQAMERLSQIAGWSKISSAGPQTLSDDEGGVTAFKFRDPDGHPLEFLQFATGKIPAHWRGAPGHGVHQGIDHSALSVADVQRSVHFYESLGMRLSNRTLNQGAAQQRLDGVPAPIVDVISLAPRQTTPHVELLHYHTDARPTHDPPTANDTSATRLIFSTKHPSGDAADRLIQDPDGHFLQFE